MTQAIIALEQSNSLTDLAARIRTEHEATSAAFKRGVQHAMAAGDLLIEAKAQVSHGQWLAWLKANCKMSERTAQLYARLAKNRVVIEKYAAAADLPLREAFRLIDDKSDFEDARAFGNEHRGLVLPPDGHLKIGVTHAGDEVWVAASSKWPGYYFVTHVVHYTPDDTTVQGLSRPALGEFVPTIVKSFGCDPCAMEWRDEACAPWPSNVWLGDAAAWEVSP